LTATSAAEFFDDLSHRGHEPLLERVAATVRFDIIDGDRTEHRLVRINRGDIRVEVSDVPADCVIIARRAVCDDVVSGRTSALAALLRGEAAVEGDPELMVLMQRLFPREPATSAPRRAVTAGGPSS
jgi:putative sterol carrier protein